MVTVGSGRYVYLSSPISNPSIFSLTDIMTSSIFSRIVVICCDVTDCVLQTRTSLLDLKIETFKIPIINCRCYILTAVAVFHTI